MRVAGGAVDRIGALERHHLLGNIGLTEWDSTQTLDHGHQGTVLLVHDPGEHDAARGAGGVLHVVTLLDAEGNTMEGSSLLWSQLIQFLDRVLGTLQISDDAVGLAVDLDCSMLIGSQHCSGGQ